MNLQIALLSILSLAGITLFASQSQGFANTSGSFLRTQFDQKIMHAYTQWKNEQGKNTNGIQDQYRFAIFRENYIFIESHNAINSDITLGLTSFADMTNTEYREQMLNRIDSKQNFNTTSTNFTKSSNDLPKSVDWNKKGAVTPVANQGYCGACWAFASIGALEGLNQIVTGNLIELSQQQLVSCMMPSIVFGCRGANSQLAYAYTQKHGAQSADSYPYTNAQTNVTDTHCKYNKQDVVFQNTGYGKVTPEDTQAMKLQLTKQPLAVSVDAGSVFFQFYKSGVLQSQYCGTKLNHEITAYGYQDDTENPYWLVKNSWGQSWGDKGFAKILISEGNGVCGINMDVMYPTYDN